MDPKIACNLFFYIACCHVLPLFEGRSFSYLPSVCCLSAYEGVLHAVSALRRSIVRRCTECTQSMGSSINRASNGDFIIRLCKRCVALLLLVFLVSAFDLRLSLVDEPHGATPILVVLDRGLHERCGLGGVRPTPTQPRWAALAGGEQQQGEADEE